MPQTGAAAFSAANAGAAGAVLPIFSLQGPSLTTLSRTTLRVAATPGLRGVLPAPSIIPRLAAPAMPSADLPTADVTKTLPGGQVLSIKAAGESDTLIPADPDLAATIDPRIRDVVIIGAGYSGLSAAWKLKDKDILILDRETSPGGLAYQGKTRQGHITYARGAAYYTKPEDEVKEIYDSVGMTPIRKTAIREPIDSVFYKGRLIKDIWSKKSLKRLPAGFAAFKKDLQRFTREDFFDFDMPEDIPEKAKYLDKMSVEDFLRPYGPELSKHLIDSYDQSALGGHVSQVGALGFLLFYADEIVTRYTWPGGTGGGSHILARKLWEANHTMFRTRSQVREVVNTPEGVRVTYERDGRLHVVNAKKAIVATPLKVSAKLVPQMSDLKRRLIAGIQYADYVVHNIFTPSGSLYRKGYDTWVSGKSFTDFIDGRWVETRGYKKPHKGPGILTVYMPIAPPAAAGWLTSEKVAEMAATAVLELREFVPRLAKEKELTIESYRWPSSIHLTRPGYLTEIAPELIKPDGNIHYAGNNLGTPSFEVSLVSGKRAAEAVLQALGVQDPR